MATSGSTNFATNRDSLIAGALRLCGVLSQGETASSTQVTEASEALNMLVKAFAADGMPLWAIKEYSVPLTASTSSYRIGTSQTVNTPKPLKVIQAFLHNTSTNIDIPMRILTRQEYNVLGNKTSSGSPIQIFYDPQNTYGDLYVFPVPSSTDASTFTIRIVYQRPFEDFDAASDEPDFPQEWFEALKYNLADRLAGEYNLSKEDRAILKQEAKDHKDTALSFGTEEGSIYFTLDKRDW